MRRLISIIFTLTIWLVFPSLAAAINIKVATVQNGYVHIEGDQAPRGMPVAWEGSALTGVTTTNGGAFKFDTTLLPLDCVGRLTIYTETREVVINDCTPADITGGVFTTGQRQIFATRDDGDLQKGVAWPNPRFTDNLNGTVTDNLTGLVWWKEAGCLSELDWYSALLVAKNLANGICGLSDFSEAGDWRLPNRNELTSLLDLGRFDPALPYGHPFTTVGRHSFSFYWSSTTSASHLFSAWVVSFENGVVYIEDKIRAGFVIVVRGGP